MSGPVLTNDIDHFWVVLPMTKVCSFCGKPFFIWNSGAVDGVKNKRWCHWESVFIITLVLLAVGKGGFELMHLVALQINKCTCIACIVFC